MEPFSNKKRPTLHFAFIAILLIIMGLYYSHFCKESHSTGSWSATVHDSAIEVSAVDYDRRLITGTVLESDFLEAGTSASFDFKTVHDGDTWEYSWVTEGETIVVTSFPVLSDEGYYTGYAVSHYPKADSALTQQQ